MKYFFTIGIMVMVGQAFGQNVGIGTSTPTGPLSFASISGNKIVLWGDGGSSHYGIGVQGGLLQLYANQPGDAIVFGYGRSGLFTERTRITGSGDIGMTVKGRIILSNGTVPLDPLYGGGIWLADPTNTGMQGFMGVFNNQNIGFYGVNSGWGLTYNTTNGRVGIGNTNPNAPLAFAATLGKKITLYPGAVGDAGLGMSGNRLQIFADNPNADVAIGYDLLNGGFQERFAFKPNGALALQGNTGSYGQILTSGGPGAAAFWSSAYTVYKSNAFTGKITAGGIVPLTTSTINLNLTQPSLISITYDTYTGGTQCFAGSCAYKWDILTRIDGQLVAGGGFDYEGQYFIDGVLYAVAVQRGTSATFGPAIFSLAAGAHTISFESTARFGEPSVKFRALYQIIPQ